MDSSRKDRWPIRRHQRLSLFTSSAWICRTRPRIPSMPSAATSVASQRSSANGSSHPPRLKSTVAGDAEGFLHETQKLSSRQTAGTQGPARHSCRTEQFLAEPECCLCVEGRASAGTMASPSPRAMSPSPIAPSWTTLLASPRKPDFLYILRVETPDAHTVRVIYRKPYSLL